jgi:hypothetical protein
MSRVTMTHPDLPGQPIEVGEAAVPHYQASGWQVDETPKPGPTKRAARRRQKTGDES